MPADLWMMVAGVGFVVSLLLWIFLFRKFRRAAHSPEPLFEIPTAADRIEPVQVKREPEAPKPTLSPVQVSSPEPEATVRLSPVQQPAPAEVPAPAPEPAPKPAPVVLPTAAPAPAPNLRSGQTLTGGISPAVVYLQNLKEQLDGLRKEVQSVKTQMVGATQRNEAQFNEVLRRLETLKLAANNQTPPQAQAPAPAPAPAPVYTAPDLNLELPSDALGQAPAPAPAPEPQPEPAPNADPKKGPVWPT